MKIILIAAAFTVATLPAMAKEQEPGRICIRNTDIRNTQPSRDERSITFTLQNGDRLRNDLRSGRCAGIGFNGFSWVLRGDNSVCENQQTLKVRDAGVCVLGKFTRLDKEARSN